MKEIFSLPPLVAYKHPANIKDKVVRSKMPTRKRRIKRGMHHCGSWSCRTCQFVETGKVAGATVSQEVVEINAEVIIKNPPVKCDSVTKASLMSLCSFSSFALLNKYLSVLKRVGHNSDSACRKDSIIGALMPY